MKNFEMNSSGTIDCDIEINGLEGLYKTTLSLVESQKIINSGVEIAPYVAAVKTLDQLQQEAIAAMELAVITECRSGTGKLYFSDLNSAARHTNELIQPDEEIRDRAIQLLSWDIAIDAYALDVVFSIEQGGEVPTLESFIAGLPTV